MRAMETTIDRGSRRWRASGLIALAAIVVAGLVAPGYFHWKAPEIRARRLSTEAEVAGAPTSPAGRIAAWTRFGGDPQIHNRLQAMRFSAEQPWLVTHALRTPDGDAGRGEVEFHGIDLGDMPRELVVVQGFEVRLVLPEPRVLGRGPLRGDHAGFVPVYEPGAAVPDPRARAREILLWALEDLGRALERDVPGARFTIEIGPHASWSAVRESRAETGARAPAR